ncbi:MAG: nucleotidyltransferase domain-containing protein [Gaiellaceae bacterium]
MTSLNEWSGHRQASCLRQWPLIAHVAERVREHPDLEALILIGSFAKQSADEASDVDMVVAVSEGRFENAWADRHLLSPPDSLVKWDIRPDPEREIGSHRFLSRNVVKVEILLATPSSGFQLADPIAVVGGDESVVERFPRIPPIDPEVLRQYAQALRDDGVLPEVELRYSDLMRTIREAASGTS